MRKTKNIIRIVACLVFVLALTFAFASCDKISDIFNKHEHSYVPVVTQPTCYEKGFTTYTCECGDSYVDNYVEVNHTLVIHEAREATCTEAGWEEYFTCRKCSYSTYVEIAATGHDFEEKVTRFPSTAYPGIMSTICNTCGDTTDKEIEAISVTLPKVADIIRTFVGMNEYTINAENTELLLIDEIEIGDGKEKRFIAIDLACFELNGKTNELSAYVSFHLGIAEFKELAEGEKPEFTSYSLINIVVVGDDVSLFVTENDQLTESEYDLTEELYGQIAGYFGLTYDQLAETYYILGKVADLLPVVEGVIEWLEDAELPEDAPAVDFDFSSLLDQLVYVDDDGYSHLDLESLADLIESFGDMTVAKMIDDHFGKGTMAKLEVFLTGLPTTKIRTLHKSIELIADTYDIPIDDVYALVNYVIHAATGVDFNLEHEIKIRYNKTVAEVIVELTSQNENITEAEINAMALGLINSFKEIINQAKTYSIDQIYNLYYYEDANFDYSLTETIADSIRNFDASFDLTWHTAEDGTLDSLELLATGIARVKYELINGVATLEGELIFSDGTSLELDAILSDTEATLLLVSGEHVIASLDAQIKDGVLLSATYKINVPFVGAVDGYTENENLLNVLTVSYVKGEGEAYTLDVLVSVLKPAEGSTEDAPVYTYESILDVKAQYDGVDTLTAKINEKDVTVVTSSVSTDSEAPTVSSSCDVLIKEGDKVIADYVFTSVATYDEDDLLTDVELALVGTVDGKAIDMSGTYADGVLNALFKLDGNEAAKITVTLNDDGGVTADVTLNGVNLDSEILVQIKNFIATLENLVAEENAAA